MVRPDVEEAVHVALRADFRKMRGIHECLGPADDREDADIW